MRKFIHWAFVFAACLSLHQTADAAPAGNGEIKLALGTLLNVNVAPAGCPAYLVALSSGARYPCAQPGLCYNPKTYTCKRPPGPICAGCSPPILQAMCAYSWYLNTPPASASSMNAIATLSCPANPPTTYAPSRLQTLSDIRVKRDIVRLARLDDGLGLYRFRYKWSDAVYVGVMAQEVMAVYPDAVTRGPDGYLRVDYGRLGLHMQTWAEWRASQAKARR
jgi:hypothetical protein